MIPSTGSRYRVVHDHRSTAVTTKAVPVLTFQFFLQLLNFVLIFPADRSVGGRQIAPLPSLRRLSTTRPRFLLPHRRRLSPCRWRSCTLRLQSQPSACAAASMPNAPDLATSRQRRRAPAGVYSCSTSRCSRCMAAAVTAGAGAGTA